MSLAAIPLYVWLPVLLVVVTPFELGFVIFLISRLGGWSGWARRFPAGPISPEGITYPWCSARVGRINARYGRLLAGDGFRRRLARGTQAVVKFFHPPLLLPWTCVRSVGEGRVMGRTRCLEVVCEADGDVFKLYLPLEAAGVVSAQRPAA